MVFRKFVEKHVNDECLRFLGLFMVVLGFVSLMATVFVYMQLDSALSSTQKYSDALDSIDNDVRITIDRFGEAVSSMNSSFGEFETAIFTMSTNLGEMGDNLEDEGEKLQSYVSGSTVTNQMFSSLGSSLAESGSSIKSATYGFDNISYSFSSTAKKFDSFTEGLDSVKTSLSSAKNEVVSSISNLRSISFVVLVLGTMFSLVFILNGIAYGLIYVSLKRFQLKLEQGTVAGDSDKTTKPVSGSSSFVSSSKK